ncbi:MAG: exopolysaccharide biosynthesis protein [Azospirillum sp.]|nr:exopolysaccharide biosynthesis protein [Azospirillum sp.]
MAIDQVQTAAAPAAHPSRKRASELLLALLNGSAHEEVSVSDLIGALEDRAFGVVLLLFALPNCLPVPPGLASIFGLPLIFFGFQLVARSPHPWLPGAISRRRLNRQQMIQVVTRAGAVLRLLERVCRPRLVMLAGAVAERVIGWYIVLLAISIAIPLPLTNFLPAMGIAVISLGLIEEDGIAVIVGTVIGAAGLALTTSILLSLGFVVTWAFG